MVMPRSRSIGLESSTCASISRASRPPQSWMMRSAKRRLAMVDVGDDGEVADLLHAGRRESAGSRKFNAGLSHTALHPARRAPAKWQAARDPAHRISRYGQPVLLSAVTATNWVWPWRRTSSITVCPGLTPASSRSSAEAACRRRCVPRPAHVARAQAGFGGGIATRLRISTPSTRLQAEPLALAGSEVLRDHAQRCCPRTAAGACRPEPACGVLVAGGQAGRRARRAPP